MDTRRALHTSHLTGRTGSLIVAALLVFVVPAAGRAADVLGPHVRAMDGSLSELVAAGRERSPTLRTLLERLDQSNVIVYVDHAVLETNLLGRVRLVGTGGGWRYLRVQIDCRQNLSRQAATLAHELQHAVEIAEAAATVDGPSLQRLYREIGFALDIGGSRFESDRAIDTGMHVQREWLSSARGTHRTAADH